MSRHLGPVTDLFIKHVSPESEMLRTFWGWVQSVSEHFTDGSLPVTGHFKSKNLGPKCCPLNTLVLVSVSHAFSAGLKCLRTLFNFESGPKCPFPSPRLAETSAVKPLSLSYRTGFTAERRLYLFSGEIIKCAKVRNPISPAF